MYEIPTSQPDTPYWVQQTTLEGVTYYFDFQWNFREEAWFMSILDADLDPILSGRRIVLNFPLLRLVDERRPPGQILALAETGGEDPGYDELGSRVKLYYLTAEEVAEAQA
jgi:hypothetical protein